MTSELDRLLAPDTPLAEALRLFAQLRTTPAEARAIEAVLARAAYAEVPEPLVVAAASALVDRGEPAAAMQSLARATSSEALMLRAELLAGGDELAGALALVERVLLRDLDWPGARERHRRWREALGVSFVPPADPSTSTMMTSAPEAPFRLLREVGRGGAGVAFEAEDRDLGRRVALKVYHHPERDRSQLLHEAHVAVALAGPGIVRVFDANPDHGWLVMEWAPGGALRALLRDRDAAALRPIERWARPLAEALARVHAAGWVHHDVKPANVLRRADGRPLLTDFGTARREGEPSPPGSLGYVSPERLHGRASEKRDDVYAYGRILEDALDVVVDDPKAAGWRLIAGYCTGRDGARPLDGAGVVSLIG
ncbi:MAG TPA: serine/threonine-protein kinase [Polyangiaceae bacterium]|nr:serine/threonine-protein kinase [Polyangiaceae bacterium]